jgi:hypothetical protein
MIQQPFRSVGRRTDRILDHHAIHRAYRAGYLEVKKLLTNPSFNGKNWCVTPRRLALASPTLSNDCDGTAVYA